MVPIVDTFAVSAGLFAALASVFSKLAFESDAKTLARVICANNECEKVKRSFKACRNREYFFFFFFVWFRLLYFQE